MSDYVKLHRVHQVPQLNGLSYRATCVWASIHLVADRRGRIVLAGIPHQDVLVRRLAVPTRERQWFYAGLREVEAAGLIHLEGDTMILVGHAGASDPAPSKSEAKGTSSRRIKDVSQTSSAPTPVGIKDVSQTFGQPSDDLPSVSDENHSGPLARARSREERRIEENRGEERVYEPPPLSEVLEPPKTTPSADEAAQGDASGALPVSFLSSQSGDSTSTQVQHPPPSSVARPGTLEDREAAGIPSVGASAPNHEVSRVHGLIVNAFRVRWESNRASLWPGVMGKPAHEVARWVIAQATKDRRPEEAIVEEATEAWFADRGSAERGWPWPLFRTQMPDFYRAPARPRPSARGVPVPVPPPSAYTTDLTGLTRIGPRQ